jgi:type II secretory pathway pseudopilin PulG
MLEMLAVLTIIGVLSVGALAGYTQAMGKYKANQAINEFENIVLGINNMYSEQNPEFKADITLLQNAGIMPYTNIYGEPITIFVDSGNSYTISYPIPEDNGYTCKQILTSKLILGDDAITSPRIRYERGATWTETYILENLDGICSHDDTQGHLYLMVSKNT